MLPKGNKLTALFLLLSLSFQFVYPTTIIAQEDSLLTQTDLENSPNTIETTPETPPVITPTPTPTPSLSPSPSPPPSPSINPQPSPQPFPSPSPLPTTNPPNKTLSSPPLSTSSSQPLKLEETWAKLDNQTVTTTQPVAENTNYSYPGSNLTIKFTQLTTPGQLTIKQIKLSKEEKQNLNLLTDVVYDLSSDMPNGSFSYNLTLPLPAAAQNTPVQVKFAPSQQELETAQVVTQPQEKTDNTITIKNLDHFTIFVIAGTIDTNVPVGIPFTEASSDVVINEFVYHPSTGDLEWVELYNQTNADIDLIGWTLEDQANHIRSLSGTLPANGFFVYQNTSASIFNNTSSNNQGDQIYLKNGQATIDLVEYLRSSENLIVNTAVVSTNDNQLLSKSIGRKADGSLDPSTWIVYTTPSQGTSNQPEKIIYVSPNGDDLIGNGTQTSPYQTIQQGIDTAPDGWTINVAAGTYNESLDLGLNQANLTITGVGNSDTGTIVDGDLLATDITPISNLKISGIKFTNGFTGVQLNSLDSLAFTSNALTDNLVPFCSSLTLTDVASSQITDNSFSGNDTNLTLEGDLSDTQISYNDFFTPASYQVDSSTVFNPPSLSFNWWGSPATPDSNLFFDPLDLLTLSPWLVNTKDTGQPGPDYNYIDADNQIAITGGTNSTTPIYVGRYAAEPDFGGLTGSSQPVSHYYDVVTASTGSVNFPLRIEIKYDPENLPSGLSENELQGIYYHNQSGWHPYTDTGVDQDNHLLWANADHLTPIVAAGQPDSLPPQLSFTSPPAETIISGNTTLLSTATDNPSGIASVAYYYQRRDNTDSYHQITSLTQESYSYAWDTASLTLDDYNLKVIATDNAGNQSSTEKIVSVAAVISQETGSATSKHQLKISWNTDRPTSAKIVYDTVSHPAYDPDHPNLGYAFATETFDTNPKTTSHTIYLNDLSSSTIYYYRIVSSGSPMAISNEKHNQTHSHSDPPDPSPPSSSDSHTANNSSPLLTTLAPAVLGISTTLSSPPLTEILLEEKTEETPPASEITPSPTGQVLGEQTTLLSHYWWIIILALALTGFIYLKIFKETS